MHFGSPSHRLPIVLCTSASLGHLAAQLASPSACILSASHLPPCLCSVFVLLSDCFWWTNCRFCCLRSQLIPVDPILACSSVLSKAPVCSPCSCDRQLFLILLLPYEAPSPHYLPCPIWVAILVWVWLSGKPVGFKHHVPSIVTLWSCNLNAACGAKFLKYTRTIKETPLFTLVISNALRTNHPYTSQFSLVFLLPPVFPPAIWDMICSRRWRSIERIH